jgi:hypothetical protein
VNARDLTARRLTPLTPADFALVRRRPAVIGTAQPDTLVSFLETECEGRSGSRLGHSLHGRRGDRDAAPRGVRRVRS